MPKEDVMPNDTTLKSVFDYAKIPLIVVGEFPFEPVVRATYVEHAANQHPPNGDTTADRVWYANGPLTLSANKKELSGEMKVWSNYYKPGGSPPFSNQPSAPEDEFAEDDSKRTVRITVTEDGQAWRQYKVNGSGFPFGTAIDATFENAMFVEKSPGFMRSLSFTLDSTPA
jgi:hypothetical protein